MKLKDLKNKKIRILLNKFEIDSEDLLHHIERYSGVDEEYDADMESIETYIKERYIGMIGDDILNALQITIGD